MKCIINKLFTIVTASEDFEASSFPITFVPDSLNNHTVCVNISIVFDDIVEVLEDFILFINSSDSSVQIPQPNVSVFIFDNSSEFITRYIYIYFNSFNYSFFPS